MSEHRATFGILIVLAVSTLLVSCASMSGSSAVFSGSERRASVQGIIGASMIGDDEVTVKDRSTLDPELSDETDLSTMPLLGAAGQWPLMGNLVQAGIEAGILVSWNSDSVKGRSGGGGTVIKIDTELVMLDLFFGPYVSTELFDRLRVYGGAGPAIVFAWLDAESDEDDGMTFLERDETDNDVDLGFYGRAGVEYKLSDGHHLGLGVRGVSNEFYFDSFDSDVEVEGLQAFLTYTMSL